MSNKKENRVETTPLPFIARFKAGKEKVSEGTNYMALDVDNVPMTREAVDELNDLQIAGLVTLAVRQVNQHQGSQSVRARINRVKVLMEMDEKELTKELQKEHDELMYEDGDIHTVDFLEFLSMEDSQKTNKVAQRDKIIQDLAAAAIAGDMDEVKRLQELAASLK